MIVFSAKLDAVLRKLNESGRLACFTVDEEGVRVEQVTLTDELQPSGTTTTEWTGGDEQECDAAANLASWIDEQIPQLDLRNAGRQAFIPIRAYPRGLEVALYFRKLS